MFITRIYDPHKKKVKFYDLQKRKYTGLPHLSKIYIPPAYTDVRMSCNPDSKVLLMVLIQKEENNTYIINNLLKNKMN